MVMERLLKPDEAGAIIGVSPKTLANWRSSDWGPPWSRVGGIRYQPRKLSEWVEAQEQAGQNADTTVKRETRMAVHGARPRIQPHHRLGRHSTQSDKSPADGGGSSPVGARRTCGGTTAAGPTLQ